MTRSIQLQTSTPAQQGSLSPDDEWVNKTHRGAIIAARSAEGLAGLDKAFFEHFQSSLQNSYPGIDTARARHLVNRMVEKIKDSGFAAGGKRGGNKCCVPPFLELLRDDV